MAATTGYEPVPELAPTPSDAVAPCASRRKSLLLALVLGVLCAVGVVVFAAWDASASSGGPFPHGQHNGWRLVWSDEFSFFDTTRWTAVSGTVPGNWELQVRGRALAQAEKVALELTCRRRHADVHAGERVHGGRLLGHPGHARGARINLRTAA